MNGQIERLRTLSAAMAEDDGLWFVAQTAAEAYLQQELRKLCALIEAPDAEHAGRDGCGRERSDRVATPESHRRPPSIARQEALEEAAKVCDAMATDADRKQSNTDPGTDKYARLAREERVAVTLATRIRSLKSEGTPREDGWRSMDSAPASDECDFWLEWADDMAALNPPMKAHNHYFRGRLGCWSSVFKATHWRPLPPPPDAGLPRASSARATSDLPTPPKDRGE